MKKNFLIMPIFMALTFFSCKKEGKADLVSKENKTVLSDKNIPKESSENVEVITNKKPEDFIPKTFVLFSKIEGDLNNDGLKDCVLIIKGTEKDKIITDESRGKLDRNRRGIIILFKIKNGDYELITDNNTCFSSENEDGGVYYAPELDVSVEKNNLYVHYAHGRYGYWTYTFKCKNSDFQLIGYDSSDNQGPIVMSETSINFLTGKKQFKENTNPNAESGDEVFKETWTKIKSQKPIFLSGIKNFDDLEFY
ncbi:hypothetical protein GCM10023210_16130 [Chryseobacterium ginsengisoli]|uniref:Lipoprotein n=1 Tax=Chryseobacterium ginsengisoli TaxID=363853 RepID=A0ABP9M6U4_9FLAO